MSGKNVFRARQYPLLKGEGCTEAVPAFLISAQFCRSRSDRDRLCPELILDLFTRIGHDADCRHRASAWSPLIHEIPFVAQER